MRALFFGLASCLALSVSSAAIADPANTSSAAMAAPEPMAQTSALPQAEHTEAQAANATTQASAKGEKLICHHPVHEGTILPQQICLTQQAWDRVRLQQQKNVSDWQMHGYQASVR